MVLQARFLQSSLRTRKKNCPRFMFHRNSLVPPVTRQPKLSIRTRKSHTFIPQLQMVQLVQIFRSFPLSLKGRQSLSSVPALRRRVNHRMAPRVKLRLHPFPLSHRIRQRMEVHNQRTMPQRFMRLPGELRERNHLPPLPLSLRFLPKPSNLDPRLRIPSEVVVRNPRVPTDYPDSLDSVVKPQNPQTPSLGPFHRIHMEAIHRSSRLDRDRRPRIPLAALVHKQRMFTVPSHPRRTVANRRRPLDPTADHIHMEAVHFRETSGRSPHPLTRRRIHTNRGILTSLDLPLHLQVVEKAPAPGTEGRLLIRMVPRISFRVRSEETLPTAVSRRSLRLPLSNRNWNSIEESRLLDPAASVDNKREDWATGRWWGLSTLSLL